MARGPGAAPAGLGPEAMRAEVRRVLDDVLPPGSPVGVGASGGPDSTALALLVAQARPDLALRLLHVRHGLRDDAADHAAADALAAGLGVPCSVAAVRVGAGPGPEAAARAARLSALRSLAREHGLAAVLLGHTAEDRAETVLLNLVRGAGLAGVAALRPVRELDGLVLVRPLLRLRRGDVRSVPRLAGVQVVHDPTNDDEAQRRARARREVLPALARLAGGPGDPVAALTRFAALAAADEDLLAAQARESALRVVAPLGSARLLRSEPLRALPPALARRVVSAALGAVTEAPRAAADVEAVRALPEGGSVTVAGPVRATCSQGWVVLRPVGAPGLPDRPVPAVPAEMPLPEAGLLLRSAPAGAPPAAVEAVAAAAPEAPRAPAPWTGAPSVLVLAGPPVGWTLGSLRPGERIVVGGRRRAVREVLRAGGVPTSVRDLVPVLRDAAGTPVWLPGVAAADPATGGPPPSRGGWELSVRAVGATASLG